MGIEPVLLLVLQALADSVSPRIMEILECSGHPVVGSDLVQTLAQSYSSQLFRLLFRDLRALFTVFFVVVLLLLVDLRQVLRRRVSDVLLKGGLIIGALV